MPSAIFFEVASTPPLEEGISSIPDDPFRLVNTYLGQAWSMTADGTENSRSWYMEHLPGFIPDSQRSSCKTLNKARGLMIVFNDLTGGT